MKYNILIYIPSLKETWKFKSITTHQQREMCKALISADSVPEIFIESVNELIAECVFSKHNIEQLDLIDKLIIILKLRCESIGDSVELVLKKNNKDYNVEYNFFDVLEPLSTFAQNVQPLTLESNNFKLKCSIPNIREELSILQLTNKVEITYEDLIPIFVDYIVLHNQIIDLKKVDRESQIKILEILPAVFYKNITDYISKILDQINVIKLYSFNEQTINLTFGSVYLDYIKFVLREDLYKVYQEIYVLNKQINFSSDYIEVMSPLEREMYISFLKQEHQQSSPPPQMPDQPMHNLDTANDISQFDSFAQSMGG